MTAHLEVAVVMGARGDAAPDWPLNSIAGSRATSF
jgi:hypothetical protein